MTQFNRLQMHFSQGWKKHLDPLKVEISLYKNIQLQVILNSEMLLM